MQKILFVLLLFGQGRHCLRTPPSVCVRTAPTVFIPCDCAGELSMAAKNAVQIVERFWRDVWQDQNPDAADQIVAEDFAVTSGGVMIGPRHTFKAWVRAFLDSIN